MNPILLDQDGKEIQTASGRSFRIARVLKVFQVLGFRAFFVLTTFTLAALAGLAGTVLMIALFTLLSALLITRAVFVRKRPRTTRNQGQGENSTEQSFFHRESSLFSLGIRSTGAFRDRKTGPVTFFFSRRIPSRESQE